MSAVRAVNVFTLYANLALERPSKVGWTDRPTDRQTHTALIKIFKI